ncbi:glycosyltransferase family 50 protein [Sphaerobolus stellatus SS14]|uniref:GPI mannosyltransferase 1 n=1 Tax=Sphaerobolus stellatus (strain SS14) TaxID=990650 RepID=A0A0C9UE36_SPHS4|nr:glycosyltransferase family 50 protein [Sphaerobolus stellatus SS14]
MLAPTFSQILISSAVLRLALIIYSEYHDAHSVVKYTDVDYRVFTDAARFLLNREGTTGAMAQGVVASYVGVGDPYLRDTYRYTPLLALIITPNITLHPSFGKALFSICDLLVGAMLYNLFVTFPPRKTSDIASIRKHGLLWVSALWLFNPMVFTISTRGSSESVLGLLVIGTLFLVMKGHRRLAAIMFGFSVHWKIYPIIYGASILAYYGARSKDKERWTWLGPFSQLFSSAGLKFALLSASVLAVLTGTLYLIWGYPLLWHSYLYHLGRLDHRHNFSPYFYGTYLTYPGTAGQASHAFFASNPLSSFLPQMGLSLGSGFLLGGRSSELPVAWFVQTMIFVTFNKICTSQYFIWYMWFLPLVLPRLRLSLRDAILMMTTWIGTQALWLSFGYKLEFLGEQVYLPLWGASMLFLVANSWILAKIIESS